ncbi:MAG: 2-amino-4-hydroxy-6-hydroxymethyldihydropteridine diphosphokinase [Gammaproteobacteria bacterium]
MTAPVWQPAYIGLGSNLGDPVARLRAALDAIAALPGVTALIASPFYRTTPFGPVVQPDFVNAAAGVLTTLDPGSLHAELRGLEQRLGRRPPRERWGPREIDLDLLVHGAARCDTPVLTLPHPGIPQRDFVLYPLRDIAPDLLVPGLGPVRGLAARVEDRGATRLE